MPEDRSAPPLDPTAEAGVPSTVRRRRRATGGVAPTREVADPPVPDEADDWRRQGPDDERLIREVPPHW